MDTSRLVTREDRDWFREHALSLNKREFPYTLDEAVRLLRMLRDDAGFTHCGAEVDQFLSIVDGKEG